MRISDWSSDVCSSDLPGLIQRIGAVTATEIAGSGIEWTFAPTLAVPQDLRWGRSYEGYSSDPQLVAAYARAMVLGLQGPLATGRPVGDRKSTRLNSSH